MENHQHLRRLLTINSNTTLVKVKFLDFVNGNKVEFNSNTTLVKVKFDYCQG